MHILIVWSNALSHRDAIIADLNKEFKIRKIFRIHWEETAFLKNLRIFYAHSQKHLSSEAYSSLLKNKMDHCGNGDFTAIVFEDEHPHFEERETTGGVRSVNTRVFDKKVQYRLQVGDGHKIHASDDAWETNKDLTVLFGLNTADFLDKYKVADLQEECYARDCVGAEGYASIRDLFYVLNNTIKYCVLRNHECLPDEYTVEGHGDIDLLVENKNYMTYLTSATPVFSEPYRVYSLIKIGGKEIPFDFRFVGDDYYDMSWERQIVDTRVLSKDLFYVPDDENQFYSLLYHAYIQKNEVKADYIPVLKRYAGKIGLVFSPDSKTSVKLLDGFLSRNQIEYIRPQDFTVVYNRTNLNLSAYAFRYGEFIKRTDEDGRNGYVYATKVYRNKDCFVKMGTSWLIENEALYLKQLSGKKGFPQLLSLESEGEEAKIKISCIQGADFITFFKDVNHQRRKYLQSFLLECIGILITLNQENICHRDFLPANLIISEKDSYARVGLIDFGWAVTYDEKNPKMPLSLGGQQQSDKVVPDMFTFASFLIEYWEDLPYVRIISYLLRKSESLNRSEQLQLLRKTLKYARFLFTPYDAFRLFIRRHQRIHFIKEKIKRFF